MCSKPQSEKLSGNYKGLRGFLKVLTCKRRIQYDLKSIQPGLEKENLLAS